MEICFEVFGKKIGLHKEGVVVSLCIQGRSCCIWRLGEGSCIYKEGHVAFEDLEKALSPAYKEATTRQLIAPFSQERKECLVVLPCTSLFYSFIIFFLSLGCSERGTVCVLFFVRQVFHWRGYLVSAVRGYNTLFERKWWGLWLGRKLWLLGSREVVLLVIL